MPIPRDVVMLVAKAFKIIKLRQMAGFDDIQIRLNAEPDLRGQLEAATWAAAFELASEVKDAYTLADRIERIYANPKGIGIKG